MEVFHSAFTPLEWQLNSERPQNACYVKVKIREYENTQNAPRRSRLQRGWLVPRSVVPVHGWSQAFCEWVICVLFCISV